MQQQQQESNFLTFPSESRKSSQKKRKMKICYKVYYITDEKKKEYNMSAAKLK